MPLSEFDIGYALGLIASEGSFTSDPRQPALSVKMHERDRRPLEHLQLVFGGRIFGPYAHGERRYYIYLLRGPELRASVATLIDRMPASHKRDQLLAWVDKHQDAVAAGPATAVERSS